RRSCCPPRPAWRAILAAGRPADASGSGGLALLRGAEGCGVGAYRRVRLAVCRAPVSRLVAPARSVEMAVAARHAPPDGERLRGPQRAPRSIENARESRRALK